MKKKEAYIPPRKEKVKPEQKYLFDIKRKWEDEWWGMPEFKMKDVAPLQRITINFICREDVKKFCEKTGLKATSKTDSLWFPEQKKLKGDFEYRGPKTKSRYPICIPSKGRADCQTTGRELDKLGCDYLFFVEENEAKEYESYVGSNRIVKMPFNNLGKGSVPARNFIWEWAKKNNYQRHWVIDDNIKCFRRTHNNRRIIVRGGGFFNAMEDFVDRYKNIGMCGPHHTGFVNDRNERLNPYILNTRVYSCILIDTGLNYRWRGRYNEDTDLSLRMLKDGICTLLFNALLMDKGSTNYGDGNKSKAMKGGNTDNVYNENDYRLAFAQSIVDQHPDVAKVVWKFKRWHHEINYKKFRDNDLIPIEGLVKNKTVNDYGMKLVKIK